MLSALIDDPTGYGRIIRDDAGTFLRAWNIRMLHQEELASCEINSGMYIFDTKELSEALVRFSQTMHREVSAGYINNN